MPKPDDRSDFDPNAVLQEFNRKLQQRDEPLDLDSLIGALGQTEAIDRDSAKGVEVDTGFAGTAGATRPGPRRGRRMAFGDEDIVDVPHVELRSVELPEVGVPERPEPGWRDGDRLIVDLPVLPDMAAPLGAPEIELPTVEDATAPDVESLDSIVDLVSRQAADELDAPGLEPGWTPSAALALRRHEDPRLLAQWAPGTWTAALRRAHGPSSEVSQGSNGPVVETFAPQLLLALWPPQGADQPLLQRWPQQVKLIEAEADAAAASALALIPSDATLWFTPADVDWALVAEVALHHEAGLRDFQIEALRALAQSEREAAFARINDDYAQPHIGAPVQRKPGP